MKTKDPEPQKTCEQGKERFFNIILLKQKEDNLQVRKRPKFQPNKKENIVLVGKTKVKKC